VSEPSRTWKSSSSVRWTCSGGESPSGARDSMTDMPSSETSCGTRNDTRVSPNQRSAAVETARYLRIGVMSRPELTPFSYAVLVLVGAGGAGPHDLVRMARQGRVYWEPAESQ